LRTLCLGIGTDKNPQIYKYISTEAYAPTLYDYDFIILNLEAYSSINWYSLSKKRDEFEKFFQNHGRCIVITDRLQHWNSSDNYQWCPFSDKFIINNITGETITILDKKLKELFQKVSFSWNLYFSKLEINYNTLATNRTNDPICINVPYLNGQCLFLPHPSDNLTNQDNLFSYLLNQGLDLFPVVKEENKGAKAPQPAWYNVLSTNREQSIMAQHNELTEKLDKYRAFKKLYYLTGEDLEDTVMEALTELGLTINRLPKGSHADFEFPLNDGKIAVCETKGLNGSATLQDLRQLLEYYVGQRDIERRNVLGIFIVNHFKNEEPSKRGPAVTKDGLDLIKKYSFTILTTVEIFNLLERYWVERLTKEQVISYLVTGKGYS
jgi:hypothetical protein